MSGAVQTDEVFEKLVLLDELPYLAEHRVGSAILFPATGFFELAIAAFDRVFDRLPTRLHGTRIEAPLVLGRADAPRLRVALTRVGDHAARFAITSRRDTEGDLRHLEGSIVAEAEHADAPGAVDLDALLSRLEKRGERADVARFYEEAERRGNHWGPPFQGIAEAWTTDEEVVARIVPPREVVDDLVAYHFHPAVVDAALHAIALCAYRRDVGGALGAFVGDGVGEVSVFAPLPRAVTSHARVVLDPSANRGVLVGEAMIYGPDGRPVMAVRGLRLRFLRGARRTPRVEAPPLEVYTTQWVPERGAKVATERRERAIVTLHADLANAIRASGARAIATTTEREIAKAVDELEAAGHGPFDVALHLGGATDVAHTLGPLLHAARRIGRSGARGGRLHVFTEGAHQVDPSQPSAIPAQAAAWGFARSLRAELGPAFGLLADLETCATLDGRARALGAALDVASTGDDVAIRGGARFVERLGRAAPIMGARPELHGDGAYVVSGGLGSIGLATARWLAGRGARRLVLLSRNANRPRAGEAVRDLTAAWPGCQVTPVAVDVAERAALGSAIHEAAGDAPIRGVFHAAGVIEAIPVAELDEEHLSRAVRAKVEGAENLLAIARGPSLDHFVCYSSLSALFPSPRLAAYAAANAYLDAFARRARAEGAPVVSIGWGAWRNSAMVHALLEGELDGAGSSPWLIEEADGVAALGHALGARDAHLVIPGGHGWGTTIGRHPMARRLPILEDLLQDVAPRAAVQIDEDDFARVRAAIVSKPVDARTRAMSAYVMAILGEHFEIPADQLSETTSLVDLGVDSISAEELALELERRTGLSFPATVLLSRPTVARLAEAILDLLGLEGAPPPARAANGTAFEMHSFASSDGLTIFGHLTIPPGDGPFPLVVVHQPELGGALDMDGNHRRTFEHDRLTPAGFAVFTVDQRGAPGHGATYMARRELGGRDVDDLIAALRHARALPRVDGRRVALLGTSRGAYCAALAIAREPDLVRAAILSMGFYDALTYVERERKIRSLHSPLLFFGNGGWDEVALRLGDPSCNGMRAAMARVPLRIVHGDADKAVDVAHAHSLAGEQVRHGGALDLEIVPGMGHDLDQLHHEWPSLWARNSAFLRRHLG